MISPGNNIIISPIVGGGHAGVDWDVLRLDLVHPVVSGNKLFKLEPWLRLAEERKAARLVTFGGPWSNHIVATAYIAREAGLRSTGIIRGEEPSPMTDTLREAMQWGMELRWLGRSAFRKAREQEFREFSDQYPDGLVIPEGGYGEPGALGAEEMLRVLPGLDRYTHIVCACGTGTMLAGLVRAAAPGQSLVGVDVVGQGDGLRRAVQSLLPPELPIHWETLEGWDRGGYARHDATQLRFMERFYQEHQVPSDIVYTGKLFMALDQLMQERYFPSGSRILAIHSGGLQGNRSLPPGTISF